ncbi:hypothetical protein ACWGI9_27415 [Streptomyces sp. NPDC054833]
MTARWAGLAEAGDLTEAGRVVALYRIVSAHADGEDPRRSLLAKLHARDRAQLVIIVCESGLAERGMPT